MGNLTCPTCQGRTPDRFQLCGHCGTRLAADRAVQEIQRFVTVINSDLKGSTALGEKLDPESLRELLGLYFDEMRLVFESRGGRIEKIIGDAIVAVFGPTADADDDALRALQAAAESQATLASLNDRLEATWGIRLVVRTGVASGNVFFGEASLGQHVLTGPTMTIATAMEQNAPPLEVLVAGSTMDLVGDRARSEPMGPVTPKGTDLVVPSHRLVSVDELSHADKAAAELAAAGLTRCPACGDENPDDFRHCGMCGQMLTFAAVARDSRKTVTIVFADPKPTTLDGGPPSPEAISDVMPRYFEAMKAALEHHGGTVEKFIGDAVMAVFGLPVRHEDDAVRAVRAAAGMQAALPELNEQFREVWGLELRNHIGVNTGEVIAGDASLGQRLVTGDAVNTAARLEQAAGAQEIVLGHLTYRLARDQIEVEAIPPLTLKGKAEPVPAYRLVGVRQRPAERASRATPFVGREAEMARLRDALFDAEGHQAARLVTVVGDAGVGKSRLVREFATSVSSEAEVVRGRCLPYGDGITFWPIGEIVRSVAGISDDDDAEEAIARIASLVREEVAPTEDAAAIAERVGAAVGLSASQFQMPELFYGIRKLLEALGRQRPLVVIVDDIHAAAPAFLELLDHLREAVTHAPILLMTTARHELMENHGEWAEAHEAERIVLEPLTASDAEAIVGQLLRGLDEAVRERIVAAAEGNPLYVEQITAMLVETGALRQEDGRWESTSSSGEVAIPPTVQALVAARLDALSAEERAIIEPASVIGLSFPQDAVEELIDHGLRPTVGRQLGSLTTKQLVRPSSAGDEEMFRFGHLVIKDTTYGSLLKRIRATLHEQFVDWAEKANRDRGRETEFEEIHGYHLEQAYRYRTELGPVDDDVRVLAKRASSKLESAGRRAYQRADMAAASNLLLRAADLLDRLDPTRVELLIDAAEALGERGEYDRSDAILEEARTIAIDLGDPRLEASARLGRFLNQVDTGDPDFDISTAIEETLAASEAFASAHDDAGSARAWRMIALLRAQTGRFEEATRASQRWIEHARQAGDEALSRSGATVYSIWALLGPTPVGELVPYCEEILEQVAGHRKSEAGISRTLSLLYAMQGSFDRSRSLYVRAQRSMNELGPSLGAGYIGIDSGRVELLAGDPAAAEREFRRDYDALGAMGEQNVRSTMGAFLAEALYQQDRLEDASQVIREVRELAAPDDAVTEMLWKAVEAKLQARGGEAGTAIELADSAVALAREVDAPALTAGVLVDAGEVRRLCGRPESSGPPWREALTLFERKGDEVSAARIRERLANATS